MQIIRSVIVQDETPAADGVYAYDLPVNPLSHIDLTIKCLNLTVEATLANVLSMVPKVEVLYKGQGVVSMSAADLFALNCLQYFKEPVLTNRVATDNAVRSLGLRIPMGRWAFNPNECFPASRKGEFQLQLTVDIAVTNADGLILQVETVELLGAEPAQYQHVSTMTRTPSATGQLDIDLPIGNVLAGVLMFSTTVPTGIVWTTTIDQARLLVDNMENQYAKANWESMHADLIDRIGYAGDYSAAAGNDLIYQYSLMDLDPSFDLAYAVETAGKSSVKVRIEAGDTQPVRLLPIEIVRVGG